MRLFERDPALEWDIARALGRQGALVADLDGSTAYHWSLDGIEVLVRVHQPLAALSDDEDEEPAAPLVPPLHALVVGPSPTWMADRALMAQRVRVEQEVAKARASIDDGGDGVDEGGNALRTLLTEIPHAAAARTELCRALYESGDSVAARAECEAVRRTSLDAVNVARSTYYLALMAAADGDTAAAAEALASLQSHLEAPGTPAEAKKLLAAVEARLAGLRGARDEALVQSALCGRAAFTKREVERAEFVSLEFGLSAPALDKLVSALDLSADDCDE